jgi:hypothetical protein
MKHLHYRTDAEGLIVVVDSNGSAVHQPTHELATPDCRFCHLQMIGSTTVAELRPVRVGPPLKIAIGVAVPAIEAWYRCGIDARVTESNWLQSAHGRTQPYSKATLKDAVYGTERPPFELQRQQAIREAERLARDLRALEVAFPNGFGGLAQTLRTW